MRVIASPSTNVPSPEGYSTGSSVGFGRVGQRTECFCDATVPDVGLSGGQPVGGTGHGDAGVTGEVPQAEGGDDERDDDRDCLVAFEGDVLAEQPYPGDARCYRFDDGDDRE